MNIRLLPAVGALMGAACLTSTTAAPINVQFGSDTYIGYGAAPSAQSGRYWNFYKSGSHGRMFVKETENAETSAVIWATYRATFGGSPLPSSGNKGRSPGHLLRSGIYGPIEFNIQGLDPAKRYDVYAYVSNKSNEPTTVTMTDATGASVHKPEPVNQDDEFRLNENYVIFRNRAPVGEHGRLSLTVEGPSTGLNGLQFIETETTPPPPPQNPPTVRIRSKGGAISTTRPRVTIQGSATSDAGIRAVWVSYERGLWKMARGSASWQSSARITQRTRIFVRAEDVNGLLSAEESVAVVPKRRR